MAIDQQTIIELEKRLMEEIDTLREEKNSLAEELKTVKLALEKSIANETSTRVKELSAANTAIQDAISSTQQSTQQLKSDIENGNVIAQKALMLRARNNNHWMKFKETDSNGNDFFSMFRTDGNWFDRIKVG